MIPTFMGGARASTLLLPLLLAACGGDDSAVVPAAGSAAFNVSESVSSSSATVGDRVTWTVTAVNSGSAATTGTATLLVNVPSALTGLSATAAGASCGAVVSTLTCTIPAGFAAGASASVIFSGTATTAGTLASNVQPTGAGATGCASSADCSTSTTVAAAPVVAVTAAVDKTSTAVGATIHWTLTATNTGGPTSSAITLTDTLPASGIGTVTATPTGASCAAVTGNTLTCTIPAGLATNGSASIVIAASASAVGSLVNTVVPTGTGASCASAAVCTTTTTVAAATSPNVGVTNGVNETTGLVGDTLSWTLTATNSGTGATTAAITLTDTLPASGIGSVTVTPTGASCAAVTGNTLTCTIPAGLAAGGGVASVLVSAPATAAGSLVNTVAPGTGASCASSAACTTTTAISAASAQIANSCGVMINVATLDNVFGGSSGSMVSLLNLLGTTSSAGPNVGTYLVGLGSTGDPATVESWTTPGTPAGGSAAANSTVAASGTQFICASENGSATTGASSTVKYTADLVSSTSAAGNLQISKQVGSNGGFVLFNLPSLTNFSFEYFRGGSNGYSLDYSTDGATWHNIESVTRSAQCTSSTCEEVDLLTTVATSGSNSFTPTAPIKVPVLLRITNTNTSGTMVIQKIMIQP